MNAPRADLIPNPVGPFPPLPQPLQEVPIPQPQPVPQPGLEPLQPFPVPFPWPPLKFRSVRCGCYLLNYKPSGSPLVTYDGTLRVECHGSGRTASGDLYQRPLIWLPWKPGFPPIPSSPLLLPGPSPSAGIPILSRGRYRYYLRVTQILEYFTIGTSFTLGFEMWRFTKSAGAWSTGGTWTNEGTFTALMSWQAAPAGYPSSSDYLAGDVKNSGGTVVGRLTMGWISAYLRKATVEIDRVSQSESPLHNGAGVDWKAIGDGIGWDITVDQSDSNLVEPSGESWSDAECHAAMLARRDASNLDAEWRYHVLCVRRLDSTSRGIMYDAYGGDSNNVPREGCAIASHWTVPTSAEWGLVKGVRFGTATSPYFRTAVHETGHAMGLYHNTSDNGFMNTTDVIANNSLSPGSAAFPNNVQWSYHADDAKRLRHIPDIYVRPGGTPFGTSYATTPISPTDMELSAEGLLLTVTPVHASAPLGAPIRLNLELTNTTDEPVPAPATLSMKSGFVRGHVTDPAGTVRTFSPIILCVEDHPMVRLKPRQGVRNSMTLLRGSQGALFPMPGAYRVDVEVHWDQGGVEVVTTGSTDVMVSSASDEAHAQAALKVLSTPDTLLTLVVGGDHLTEGIEAIQTALKNPVLRPHYAYIEAKRLGERFGTRKANLKAVADLLDDAVVMSPAEIRRAAELAKTDASDGAAKKAIAKRLKQKATGLRGDEDVKAAVESIQ